MLLSLVAKILWWWFLACLLAITEIEMEGKFGWATRTATAYRVTGWPARIYGAAMNGKPLSYWNLFMQMFLFLFGHAGYAFGLPFTWTRELEILYTLTWWAVIWDFTWFGLHPDYNPKGRNTWNMEKLFAGAWWHLRRHAHWPLKGLPVDYTMGLRNVLILGLISTFIAEDREQQVLECLGLVGGTSVLVVLTLVFGTKPYQTWYAQAHDPAKDERHLVVPNSHR